MKLLESTEARPWESWPPSWSNHADRRLRLRRSIHFGAVIHILGFLLIFLAGAMLVPIPFSIYYGDGDFTAFLLSMVITLSAGLLAFKTTKLDQDLRPKEGFAVVTFAWVCFSVFGTLPFLFSGAIPAFTDAMFETVSGFTTTGSSIVDNIEAMPHGVLFWRSLTHWIGGMGIIVLSLAVLPFLGVGGMQLFEAEMPGPMVTKLAPRIAETARLLAGVYVLLSALLVVFLIAGGMNFFEALCHSFGTMATGGFSTRNASLGAYQSTFIRYVVICFMLLAGANFSLHYRFLRGDFRAHLRNAEFRLFLLIVVVSTLLIGIDTHHDNYRTVGETAERSLFQVVSILTTTGFATANYVEWSSSSQLLLFAMMFIGGCAGSTSGGMKIMRIHILLELVLTEVVRLIHPRAVLPVRLGGVVVPRAVVTKVLGFSLLFVAIFVVGVLVMAAIGLDLSTAMGAVAANLGNIGPGLGKVGPADNYAQIPLAGKWVLSLLMLIGRLEIFTVIVLFSPAFWQK